MTVINSNSKLEIKNPIDRLIEPGHSFFQRESKKNINMQPASARIRCTRIITLFPDEIKDCNRIFMMPVHTAATDSRDIMSLPL